MALTVKVLVAKRDNLSSIPRTHMVGENLLQQVVLDTHSSAPKH